MSLSVTSAIALSRAYMSPSTSISPATYARARPSVPGAVASLASALGVVIRRASSELSGPALLPSYPRTRTGMSVPTTVDISSATCNALTRLSIR
jgi:hypothetical protein